MDDATAIWEAILAANTAWQGGDPAAAGALFDEAAVMAAPSGEPIQLGRDEIVEGYAQYLEAFQLRAYEEGEPDIHLFGDTAVVIYPYVVRLFEHGKKVDGAGREQLVLHRVAGTWKVVWRMPLFETEDEDHAES